jgi:hypothetical protein
MAQCSSTWSTLTLNHFKILKSFVRNQYSLYAMHIIYHRTKSILLSNSIYMCVNWFCVSTTNLTAKDWDVKLIFSLLHFHCLSGNNGCCNSRSHGNNSSEIVSRRYIRSDVICADNGEGTKWSRSRAVWRRQVENFDWHCKPLGPWWSATESTERGKAVWWQGSGWPKALLSSAYNETCRKGNSLMPAWLVAKTHQLVLSYCPKTGTKIIFYKSSPTRDTEA